VLRIDIETANRWSGRKVLEIAIYRSRLCDISWFMRCLNEPIARQANQEDNCTGRFWEGRFKSQALLDEAAVLACMTYVDYSLLKESPIRAQLADTPEQSDHTSIQLRIRAALKGEQPSNLLPFIGNECDNQPNGIAFSLTDYLELVDDTGRIIRNDKRGHISENSAKILNRLNIPRDNWLKLTTEFGKLFHGPVGTLQELTDYCEHLEKRRRHFAKCCQHFNSN